MMNETKELKEAILASEKALKCLRQAEEKLNRASNWGLLDLLGGDLISGIVKHSKIEEATLAIEEAKRNLVIFQRELRDVNQNYHLQIDIGGFLLFADFFFDGLIADYLVQSKIKDAKIQVQDAIHEVSNMLSQLRAKMQ